MGRGGRDGGGERGLGIEQRERKRGGGIETEGRRGEDALKQGREAFED